MLFEQCLECFYCKPVRDRTLSLNDDGGPCPDCGGSTYVIEGEDEDEITVVEPAPELRPDFDGPIHNMFGLTYASYFVAHRSVLQAMPREWQERFVALMNELEEIVDISQIPQSFTVQTREGNGRFVKDPFCDYRYPLDIPTLEKSFKMKIRRVMRNCACGQCFEVDMFTPKGTVEVLTSSCQMCQIDEDDEVYPDVTFLNEKGEVISSRVGIFNNS